jgi:hypothetical protein
VDAVGKSAWDVRLRRTDLMFHREESGRARGALAEFLDELAQQIDPSWDTTRIGHSMGSIVVNRILTEYDAIEFDRIVYMGAAATVGDCEDAVFPYLRSHPAAHMYHLTLRHKSEVRETAFAPVLQGSLLVWIDDFLSTPITPRGRTVGRYLNLISARGADAGRAARASTSREFDAGAERGRRSAAAWRVHALPVLDGELLDAGRRRSALPRRAAAAPPGGGRQRRGRARKHGALKVRTSDASKGTFRRAPENALDSPRQLGYVVRRARQPGGPRYLDPAPARRNACAIGGCW